ncbi:MAG TPA: flagellar biosynthesis protein FlhB [Persephonella sp.]|uniref:Flagellar biosynthetic protein FlhB n=1 Tax=Persephonella marina (strain DSM 14350 / EX-H1) TaxID=123214 RepID=C0QT95_PERMH|nr:MULTISPECIES: EscU/YscU/HrcU family type III secretion system export apparatus switch protein [Persephonella]ACO04492.1 flagellar biosynthetic protein FlhB [Persephonella marina EX-H1]HCB70471.1 flagellar biosynthesis protein FlhB [Persephonella sp.]
MKEIKKAVALRYDREKNDAPEVVAKGQGLIAERIVEIAREYGIEIKQDRELVQILSQLDIKQEIPPELYKAVAEILIFIYRKKKKIKSGEKK